MMRATAVSDQSGIDEFLSGIDDTSTSDNWLDAYYDTEWRQLADATQTFRTNLRSAPTPPDMPHSRTD